MKSVTRILIRFTLGVPLAFAPGLVFGQAQFHLQEATITDIHNAIKDGQITCKGLVQAYVNRAKAYNGMCTALVTEDGAPIPSATGAVRAGSPVTYPTKTVPVSSVLPNVDQYKGLPIEFGRMEPTISDPSVQQQFGMRVGIPDAGQLNALETLNIRGERSVTCKGDFDRAPSAGPLPPGAPRFAKSSGNSRRVGTRRRTGQTVRPQPDLDKLPMYCVPFSSKNWYDAKDMRATGGNDVNFAMDAPKSIHPTSPTCEKRARSSMRSPPPPRQGLRRRAAESRRRYMPDGNYQYAAWGGQACNPYDTDARAARNEQRLWRLRLAPIWRPAPFASRPPLLAKDLRRGTTSSICSRPKASCMDGGIGSERPGDRAGIHCQSVARCRAGSRRHQGIRVATICTPRFRKV